MAVETVALRPVASAFPFSPPFSRAPASQSLAPRPGPSDAVWLSTLTSTQGPFRRQACWICPVFRPEPKARTAQFYLDHHRGKARNAAKALQNLLSSQSSP